MKFFSMYIGLFVLLAATLICPAAEPQQNSMYEERVKDIDKPLIGPLNVEDTELIDCLVLFADGTSIDYVITRKASRERISVSMRDPSLREFLDQVLPGAGDISKSCVWSRSVPILRVGCLCGFFLRFLNETVDERHSFNNF